MAIYRIHIQEQIIDVEAEDDTELFESIPLDTIIDSSDILLIEE